MADESFKIAPVRMLRFYPAININEFLSVLEESRCLPSLGVTYSPPARLLKHLAEVMSEDTAGACEAFTHSEQTPSTH